MFPVSSSPSCKAWSLRCRGPRHFPQSVAHATGRKCQYSSDLHRKHSGLWPATTTELSLIHQPAGRSSYLRPFLNHVPYQLVHRPAFLLCKRLCLVAVSQHFITGNRDGRCEHEDYKAYRHIGAGKRRNDGERRDRGRRDQQPGKNLSVDPRCVVAVSSQA